MYGGWARGRAVLHDFSLGYRSVLKKTILASSLAFGFSTTAHAGGYFNGNKGARAAGRAGAFTAKADDVSAAMYNPAGMARVGTTLLQIGNRFSHNMSQYTRAPTQDFAQDGDPLVEFDTVRNSTPFQPLDPILGVVTNFGKLKDWGFGLVIMSPPGAARVTFPANGGQRYMMVSRDAKILNYSLSAAWKHKDRFGFGVSVQWIHTPALKYQVVVNAEPGATSTSISPVSGPVDLLATTSGSDIFAINTVLGAWVRPIPQFEIAASGQVIPAKVNAKSRLKIDAVNPDIIGDVELSRRAEPADDVVLTLPLPMSARLGLRYRHLQKKDPKKERFDLELDFTYEAWRFAKTFELASNGLVASPTLQADDVEVGTIVIQKQWRHVFGLALGSDVVAIDDRLIVRGGLRYETPTAHPAYTNVDFATGHMLGTGVGFSVLIKGFEIAAAYEFTGMLPVEVTEAEGRVYQQTPGQVCDEPDNNCSPDIPGPSPTVNAGRYLASFHAASLELLYRF